MHGRWWITTAYSHGLVETKETETEQKETKQKETKQC